MTAAASYSLTGINRAMTILEAFESAPELSLAEISRRTGLGEATALRYVSSLGTHGLLERDDDTGRYRLGLRLFKLGADALRGRDPRALALPHMRRLLERFQESVNLAMHHGDELILIEVLESTRSIRRGAYLGERDVWDTSALGKAILAHVDHDEARRLLAAGASQIADVDDWLAELESVRTRGFAVDDAESQDDLRCVGSAIFDRHGQPRYAISVSGPASRVTHEDAEEIGVILRSAAHEISAALGHRPADRAPATAPASASVLGP